MLVLTRRKNESIMIGDDIEIKVTKILCNQAKIGVDAPKHIHINRKEALKKLKEENQTTKETTLEANGNT